MVFALALPGVSVAPVSLHSLEVYDAGVLHDQGVFSSAPIKVISKPSKRKFSLSNMDMRIDSGLEISLFNRVRSQSGSTRFLQGSPTGFLTSSNTWSTFTIVRKGVSPSQASAYQSGADFIHYNMDVVLKCRQSNLLSSTYVIRKVEKNVINTADNDPVSQLQKVRWRTPAIVCIDQTCVQMRDLQSRGIGEEHFHF